MLDTKGPEYRTGTFKTGKVHINDGDLFTFTTRDVEGDGTIVSVSYKNLAKELQPGDTILVNNGLVSFRVLAIGGQDIRCQAIIGGDLSDHKSMSFPNKVLKQTYLSEQDKKDLLRVLCLLQAGYSGPQGVFKRARRRFDRHHRENREPRGR